MKRGPKSKADLGALGQRPADLREPWQIEQGARCGCKGLDDLCPCQNENPWPRDRRGEVIVAAKATLELLDTYGPDDEQEDEDFVRVRAELRKALEGSHG